MTWLGLGNMPNMGTYFIRGEYRTGYNAISNRSLLYNMPGSQINFVTGIDYVIYSCFVVIVILLVFVKLVKFCFVFSTNF